ncbi:MAG: hypothetical protein ACKVU4_09870 [Phycisphaerales bacterium]
MTPIPRRLRTSPLLIALAALIACLLPLGSARAQFGMMGGADANMMGQFKIARSNLEGYAKLLGLDKDQSDAMLALHEGYTEQYEALTKGFQTDMEKIQEEFEDTQDITVFQKQMPKIGAAFGEKMESLEKGFLADLRALLTPQQDEQWPRIERMRLRESALRFSMISGQGVDLVDVLGDLKIDAAANPDLTDQLGRYELDLDKTLKSFEKWGKDQQKQFLDDENAFDMSKMNEMMKKVEEMMKEMARLSMAIRDVNRQYARTILPMLAGDTQDRFDQEVKRRSFPRVYKRSWVTKAVGSAGGFADLSGDQQTQLAELRAAYERELAAANDRWAAAITEKEEKSGGSMMAMMQSMMGGGDASQNDPVNEARKARKDLDGRYKDKLNALLSGEQQARLPEDKREPRDQMNPMGMMTETDLEVERDDGP